jgi:hypothetical protein
MISGRWISQKRPDARHFVWYLLLHSACQTPTC